MTLDQYVLIQYFNKHNITCFLGFIQTPKQVGQTRLTIVHTLTRLLVELLQHNQERTTKFA